MLAKQEIREKRRQRTAEAQSAVDRARQAVAAASPENREQAESALRAREASLESAKETEKKDPFDHGDSPCVVC